jgi:hypothetical protein
MYCRHCGKEVKNKAVVCTGCGNPVEDASGRTVSGHAWHWLTMLGLMVATLFAPPLGLVFGYLGLREEAKKVQGAVLMTMGVFLTLLLIAIILGL